MTGADATLVAGVDTSTQSCKVVVCDADTGEIVREGRGSHPNGTEVDPEHWWSAFQEATSGDLLEGVQALAVGGQQHGMVLLDEQDEVVRPALLWNDTRSADAARQLVDELGGPQAWADRIGVVPLAAITASKLRWVAEHEPESLRRAATCVLPHDWLTGQILRRPGGEVRGWTTDRGDASGTGYFSAATDDYDHDLVRLATGGGDLGLPRVLGPHEAAGRLARGSGGMLLGPGTGDNAAAALGLGVSPGDVVMSLGTSGTAFSVHDSPSADASGEVASYADASGAFLPLVCTLNAARVLTAASTVLQTDLAGLAELALQAPLGAEGLTLLPYLDGERTPNLPDATGTLSGITRDNLTPANLARAMVEGMVLGVGAGVDSLRREGVAVEQVHLIGGAVASRAVREVAADLLGVPVVVPEAGEYVALGAARQAASTLRDGDLPPWRAGTAQRLEARPSSAAQEVRARYRELVGTVHGV
ncbi:Xylulose kinase [Serinicoccus hydrothermalis]|uniref:Xylulose kinase n=1 Tax=Serinicoccus hydrothermalis TaxID=1758689 RepID=A0A1B1N7L1_9MICO|nr:xylulokinase [Serinicoccus hydrothermalis]ANS77422.1 Xylulose kinase [Serinicoccus hydrothermalis]